MSSDLTVETIAVRGMASTVAGRDMVGTIAVRDHGGDGPPVLLLHGAGGNLADWELFAPRLTPTYRVVAVDLRGHGLSGDGVWEPAAVAADLDAVVTELALTGPAVVGMSLGGLVAVDWAARRGDCRAVINLDGHPTISDPAQCPGLDPARAAELIAGLRATFDAMEAALAAPLPPAAVDAMLAARAEQARRHGAPEDAVLAAARRGLSVQDGQTRLRPGALVLGGIRTALDDADPYSAYRDTTTPTLVALATRDLPEQRDVAELTAAYRLHVAERLAAIDNPALRTVELDASHAMLWDQPDAVAALVTDFLATATTPTAAVTPP